MDTTKYTSNWNEITKEPRVGSPHPYVDKVIMTYSAALDKISAVMPSEFEPGKIIGFKRFYYMQYKTNPRDLDYVRPKFGDVILEIDYSSEKRPVIDGDRLYYGKKYIHYENSILNKYLVGQCVPFRLDEHGRFEYFMLACTEIITPPPSGA